MEKFLKEFKNRYFEGIAWMKLDEGFASMMYLAANLAMYFIIYQVVSEKVMQYAVLMVANLVFVYAYSVFYDKIVKNSTVRIVQTIGFIVAEVLIGFIFGKGLDLWYVIGLMFMPIAVAISMVFVQENYIRFEDFIKIKEIGRFGTVVIGTLIPVVAIAITMIYLEWSILTKILIVAAYMAISPIVCWADSENIGIFGAIGVEW